MIEIYKSEKNNYFPPGSVSILLAKLRITVYSSLIAQIPPLPMKTSKPSGPNAADDGYR
jgi:hypothetical protein